MKYLILWNNGCGLNNGNYARVFDIRCLKSWLKQDVSNDTIGLREYESIFELERDYVIEKNNFDFFKEEN